jgi:hypothetical protein
MRSEWGRSGLCGAGRRALATHRRPGACGAPPTDARVLAALPASALQASGAHQAAPAALPGAIGAAAAIEGAGIIVEACRRSLLISITWGLACATRPSISTTAHDCPPAPVHQGARRLPCGGIVIPYTQPSSLVGGLQGCNLLAGSAQQSARGEGGGGASSSSSRSN